MDYLAVKHLLYQVTGKIRFVVVKHPLYPAGKSEFKFRT